MKKGVVRKALFNTLGLLLACIIISPLVWLFISTFKPNVEIMATPFRLFPSHWVLDNYTALFSDPIYNYLRAYFLTLQLGVVIAILSLYVNMSAAYVFARLSFLGKKLLWGLCITSMYIPGLTITVTAFLVAYYLKLLNSFAVIILPAMASGYAIFFFRQFFLNVPRSFEEAAMIDGASRYTIFLRIFVPLSTSPMVIIGTSAFLAVWNSFLWPAITMTDPSKTMIMQVVLSFRTTVTIRYGPMVAAAALGAAMPIFVFMLFHKKIVKGILLSGMK